MKYQNCIKYMDNLGEVNIDLGLSRVRKALFLFDEPQDKVKVIHVAGTNGKGSTCAMIASVLHSAGYKVGMYTSPHIIDIKERIKINNRKISEDSFASVISRIKRKRVKLTYFEILTVAAFIYFSEKKVDYAVIEVGLGGRLDATNVVNPLVSVITNISLEHTKYLGKTLGKIAKEKAGIIKKNIPVVSSTKDEALGVVRKIVAGRKCKLYVVKTDKNIRTNLIGDFQKENASVAAKVCSLLDIKNKKIKKGLVSVKWPARLEYISKNVIVDCAHNPGCVDSLVKELKKIKRKKIIIFGVLDDKDYRGMLDSLCEVSNQFIYVQPKTDRALDPVVLAKYVNGVIVKDVKDALMFAKIISNNELIVVCGSIYTVSEAR